MKITARYILTTEEMMPGYRIHWKQTGIKRYPAYLGWLVILIFSSPIVASGHFLEIPFWGVVVGMCLVFHQHFLVFLTKKALKKIKYYGETITMEFYSDSFSWLAQGGESKTSWDKVYEVVFSSLGILVYPQQGIFYWIPRKAFNSDSDFEATKECVRNANVKIRNS